MQSTPQELLKRYVQSQHFTSTADIMAAMKELFRDVIQQVMEVEMVTTSRKSLPSMTAMPRAWKTRFCPCTPAV